MLTAADILITEPNRTGSARNFHLGAIAQKAWGRLGTEVPTGVQGRSPQEAKAVYRHCLRILAEETIGIRRFRTIHRLDF